jgi:hypothetical protein
MHAVERDGFAVSRRRIDLPRPGTEQFLRKRQTRDPV